MEPAAAAAAAPPPCPGRPASGPLPRRRWRAGSQFLIGGYDQEKGQFILAQPRDPDRTPFALNFDLITELRYTGFSRSARTWTDSAGVVLPVNNYDTIEVNRNWFQFSGYALDPRLQFMAVIFNSSTSNSTLFLGWIDYRFSKAFTLSAGYYKVPGSREWYDSFRYTLGADRTMATTFFRPNMSPGIWASGEPVKDLHYVAMVANSFNGLNLADNRIGSNMAFGGTLWWEPLGKFGPGPSDVEWHERPTPRIGTSLTVSREQLAGARRDPVEPGEHALPALGRHPALDARHPGPRGAGQHDQRPALVDRRGGQVPGPQPLGRVLPPLARRFPLHRRPAVDPQPVR